jgi:hypothetical protein
MTFTRNPRKEAVQGWLYRTLARIKIRLPGAPGVRGLALAAIQRTCWSFPSQWEGWLSDHRPIYIRYRFGNLSVSVGEVGDNMNAVPGLSENYAEKVGHDWDGDISLKEVCRLTGLRLDSAVIAHVDQTGGDPVPFRLDAQGNPVSGD